MEYITLPDHSILAIHCGKPESGPDRIICRGPDGGEHIIDFEACSQNYAKEYPQSTGRCIGLRKQDDLFFVLYRRPENKNCI